MKSKWYTCQRNIHVVCEVKNARFLDERPLMFLLLQHFLVLLTTETINYVYMCKIKCSCSTTRFQKFINKITFCFHLFLTLVSYSRNVQYWAEILVVLGKICNMSAILLLLTSQWRIQPKLPSLLVLCIYYRVFQVVFFKYLCTTKIVYARHVFKAEIC